MNVSTLKADGLLLAAAMIWGTAFVAQRVGMDHVGPFTYNGLRFALGSLSLLPVVALFGGERAAAEDILPAPGRAKLFFGVLLTGLVLFVGASLQQIGLVTTTAGKAGFITSLYVVIVPLLGLLLKQRPLLGTWLGAGLAAVGLYLLSVTQALTIETGDLLNLIGAFFWAAHVLMIAWLSPMVQPVRLAFLQFAVCALLSLLAAAILEPFSWRGIRAAALPIVYGGVISVGIGYTLQVVAQRDAHPAHASILLSMEAVFAALGGWLILQEIVTSREMAGCGLMLAGMLLSQLWGQIGNGRAPGRFLDR
jgi:drug/metabolite transporter (DMT)-like permease